MTEHARDCQTFVSLREYVDTRFTESDKAVTVKFAATENALNIARDSLEKRLEGMNEFREQLNRQTQTFVTRWEMLTISGLVLTAATMIASLISALLFWIK